MEICGKALLWLGATQPDNPSARKPQDYSLFSLALKLVLMHSKREEAEAI